MYFGNNLYTLIFIIKLLISLGKSANITFTNRSTCNFIINDSQLCKITRNLCNSSKEEPTIIIDEAGEVEYINSVNNDLVNFEAKKAVKLEDTNLVLFIFIIVGCSSMISVFMIIGCICRLKRKLINRNKEMDHIPLVENESTDNSDNHES